MARRKGMWMGTRGYERWVPACRFNQDFSKEGNRERDVYLNGGAGFRGTKMSHKVYNMSWDLKRRDELRPILDMHDGLFDVDDSLNLIYFLDPMTLDRNVLTQMYASPFLGKVDGVPLIDGKRPVLEPTAPNELDYPARSAIYTFTPADVARVIYVPVPPDHTAWVGVHGSGAGGGVQVSRVRGPIVDEPARVPFLSVDTRTRVDTPIAGGTGIELSLAINEEALTAEVTLTGMIVQILPDGQLPLPGDFISGQGNDGCEFDDVPSESAYNAKMDRMGMTVKMTETGPWR